MAVLLGLLPFLFVEALLRLGGYGYDTSFVISAAGTDPALHSLNPAVDRAKVGSGGDLPGPEPRPFALPKPHDVFRILVIGGSSVAGFPYPFELSFPRQLEIVLREQNPTRRFEVLNAGIVAITSDTELDLLQEALVSCSPDLIIVHSGHNEFYGVGGAASTTANRLAALQPWLERARQQRLFQWCESLVRKAEDRHLLEALPADITIPLDGATFRAVHEAYRANLARMAQAAVAARVPLLLTSVPCNVRDLSPMSSLRDPSLTERQQQEQAERERRIAEHWSYREFAAALELLQVSRTVEPHHALWAYREAQCLEQLGKRAEAGKVFQAAVDADGCRFRAPSHFAQSVREIAARHAPLVTFCDVVAGLQQRTEFPAPGNDFFLEHVHYNLDGHWAVAQILGGFIQTEILRHSWHEERVPSETRRDELLGATTFDYLMGDTFGLMILQVWPLKLAPDATQHVGYFQRRLQTHYAELSPLDQQLFADLSISQMQHDLMMAMGAGYERAGEWEKAVQMYVAQTRRRPWEAQASESAAKLLEEHGEREQAAQLRKRTAGR